MIPQEVADIIDILEEWFGESEDEFGYHQIANEIYRKVIAPIDRCQC